MVEEIHLQLNRDARTGRNRGQHGVKRGSERKLHDPSMTTRQRFPPSVPHVLRMDVARATRQTTRAMARTRPVRTPASRLTNTTQNNVTP